MALTQAEIKTFTDRGILALRGFLPQKATTVAKDAILEKLKKLNLIVKGKAATSRIQDLPVFQQIGRIGQVVGQLEEVNRLFNDELLTAMNILAKSQLKPAQPQLLISFPNRIDWSLNNLNWHLDLVPPKFDQIPGVQAFILIDDVQPHGGATLALAGSHKLHHIIPEKNAHDILRERADFAQSPEKYLKPRLIEDIPIEIVEMSGKAGDVFLMDLRILHTPSINAQQRIRLMATNRYFR